MKRFRSVTLLLFGFCSLFLLSWSPTPHNVPDPSPEYLIPTVDLGPDTAVCGPSIVLDAGNAGATFLWSTGAISQTITVMATDTFWVQVTDLTGTASDTIVVEISIPPSDPVLNDTTICGSDSVLLVTSSNGQSVQWFDAPTGGNVLGTGDSIKLGFTSTTTVYVEGQNPFELVPEKVGLSTIGGSSGGGYASPSGARGIEFDVINPFLLKAVTLYANAPVTTTIQLKNPAGAIIYSAPITLNNIGPNRVAINYFLDPATGYVLELLALSGGQLYRDSPVTFPISHPDIVFQGGSPFPTVYYYFYNWEILNDVCASNRIPVTINVMPAPSVELGLDSLVCGGSIVLDATYPGATYLWSTGATTPTVTISSTDTVSVISSIGICSVTDTTVVEILDIPSAPIGQDTSVCGVQTITISLTGNAENYLWYDSPTGGNVVAKGAVPTFTLTNSTTFYPAGINSSTVAIKHAGQIVPNVTANSGYKSPSGTRGLMFDVINPLLLKAVTLYVDGAFTATLQLKNPAGTIIHTKALTLNNIGANRVVLDYDLPAGSGYIIELVGISGGNIFLDSPYTFPTSHPELVITEGTPFDFVYYYFYDWEIITGNCEGPRTPISVNVLESPIVELGSDTVLCNTSFDLNATSPGASYLWSTGETTPIITVDSTDQYVVTASIATCEVKDSVVIEILDIPIDPVTSELNICGPEEVTLTAVSDGDTYFWYDSISGGNNIAVGNTASFFVGDSTTYYVESRNLASRAVVHSGLQDTSIAPGGFFTPNGSRGIRFDVHQAMTLKAVTVYTTGLVSGIVSITNSSAVTLYSQNVSLTKNGANKITINFDMEVGTNYGMSFSNHSGADVYLDNPGPYPISNHLVTLKQGIPFTGIYYYFYDWEIVAGYCASNRVPVNVNVAIPIDLDDELYSCEPFTYTAGSSAYNYAWNTGETTSTIQIDTTGIYSVEISDGAGCTIRDTVEVEIPINAGLPNDGILCGNILTTNYDSTAVFAWSTGDSTPTINITTPGTYSVLVNEPQGCILTDTIVISGFDSFPTVNLGPDRAECVSTTLNAGNPGFSYVWSTGEITQDITVNASGSYWVIVTNGNGCETIDSIGIGITPIPQANFTPVPNGFSVSFVNQSDFGTWEWDFGDGNISSLSSPVHTYMDTGMYIVTLIVSNSCGGDTVTSTVHITNPTGIADESFVDNINIFPNPAEEILFIETTGLSLPTNIRLLDMMGKSVWMKNILPHEGTRKIQTDLSALSKGIYLLAFETEKGRILKKVIVQ